METRRGRYFIAGLAAFFAGAAIPLPWYVCLCVMIGGFFLFKATSRSTHILFSILLAADVGVCLSLHIPIPLGVLAGLALGGGFFALMGMTLSQEEGDAAELARERRDREQRGRR